LVQCFVTCTAENLLTSEGESQPKRQTKLVICFPFTIEGMQNTIKFGCERYFEKNEFYKCNVDGNIFTLVLHQIKKCETSKNYNLCLAGKDGMHNLKFSVKQSIDKIVGLEKSNLHHPI
jgi:hypothetical protein